MSKEQWRAFWATWWGWALDGMDSFIYALVLVPALKELLPLSGLENNLANLGRYGSLMLSVFLLGWGASLLWGPLADRVGRLPTLALTILTYSLFTFLGAFAQNVAQLTALRFLAGVGIGGEWALGGTFLAESLPEKRRVLGACLMHTGYYFGIILAALANFWIGSHYGWRAMFLVGGAPALLIGFIRLGVKEPARWKPPAGRVPSIFSPEYRRRTWLNATFVLISVIGLWAGSVFVPTAVTQLAERAGDAPRVQAQLSSVATFILAFGTIVGCVLLPVLAERYGRRVALGFYFAVMAICVALMFGVVFYSRAGLQLFMPGLFFLGLGGANFAVYTVWLPEQYPTACRCTAFAFSTSAGRFVGAGFVFLIGDLVARWQTLGKPVALTSLVFVVGLLLLPFAHETRGRPLPE